MLCPRCGSEAPDWAEQCDNCGFALLETQARMSQLGPFRVGDVVAERYEVVERGPGGALFWTYAAHDQEEERLVTVRAIRPTILPRQEDHEAFARRASALLALRAPSLARHERLDRDGQTTLVVSERVEDGISLRTLVDLRRHDGRAFSAQETVAVLTLVAEALEGARSLLPHGELTPSRIVLRESDLKVEAHGLAVLLPREETVRALAATPASASYLAPEVIEGTAFDARSDVYSLAVIACELLTGRVPPEPGASQAELLSHLPSVTGGVLGRALARHMAERDSSALEMVEALAVVLGVEPLRGAQPASAREASFSDPSVEVGPARDGTQPIMPRIPDPDELLTTRPDDLSIPPAPDPEGTQQITAEMIEPARTEPVEVEAVPRDPSVPAAPAAEGTQQITADMIEPLSEEPTVQEEPRLPAPTKEDRLREMESMRSLGLDPRLVRAARKLDRQKRELDKGTPLPAVVADAPDPPGKRAEAAETLSAPALEPAAPAQADVDIEDFAPTPTDELERTDKSEPPGREGARIVPQLALEAAAELVAAGTEAGEGEAAGQLEDDELPAPGEDDAGWPDPPTERVLAVADAPPGDEPPVPRGFDGDALGPLVTSVAGHSTQSSEPPAGRREVVGPLEPGVLPAVLVDKSLAEAFGPSPPAEEATFRMQRPPQPAAPPPRPAPHPRPSKPEAPDGLRGWMVPLLVVAAAGTLLLGMALAMWLFG